MLRETTIAGTLSVLLLAVPAPAQDAGKRAAEAPLEELVEDLVEESAGSSLTSDVRKTAAEGGVERLLRDARSGASETGRSQDGPAQPAGADGPADAENPYVLPGKVRWHDAVANARHAAGITGKPVLVFQLLGRLDQEFC